MDASPLTRLAGLIAGMPQPTLKERLEEVMTAMKWGHKDVMRVSKQSSSVVSQWLGKAEKTIKTIGKLEAAIYIERESGYSALWVAKGMGPKLAAPAYERDAPRSVHAIQDRPPGYASPAQVLEQMGMLLAAVPTSNRPALADVLRGWALDAGADDRRHVLLALMGPLEKQRPAA